MTLRTLNYGNDGVFLIMGKAGFISLSVEEFRVVGSRVWYYIRTGFFHCLLGECCLHRCGLQIMIRVSMGRVCI